MKSHIFLIIAVTVILFGGSVALYTQPNAGKQAANSKADNGQKKVNKKVADNGKPVPSKTDRVDLKTKTLVSKKLDRVEETPKGKKYHYIYRVEAEPTETDIPRYNVDTQYNISYKQEGR